MKRGIRIAKSIVQRYYPEATESVGADLSYVIVDNSTGMALSPVCGGHNPAWRWAALLIEVSKHCDGCQYLLDDTEEVDDLPESEDIERIL